MVMQSDPYLDLLRKVIQGHFHRENGLRITHLLDVGYGVQPFDLAAVIDIRRTAAASLAKIAADPDERENYRERIFGFPYSMIGEKRLWNMDAALRQILAEQIPGNILEAGVWRGGTCIFARALLNHLEPEGRREVILCDSFQGLPASPHPADQPYPFHQDVTLAVSQEEVRGNFRLFGLDPDQGCRFVEGFFAESLPGLETGDLALLRADGDLYVSTRDILDNLYDRVVPGGFVIIDDYGALEPCRLAVEEFRAERGITTPLHWIDWTGVFWRKD